MKLIKYLLIAVSVLIVVFIGGAVVLVATVDPNDHKDAIISAVKDNTGRDLKLEGDIGFTFFPRLGVKLGQAELSNAPGFGKQPFAKIDKVAVSVDLLALLTARVKADTIELSGLNVNLQTNRQGKTNWDDLAKGDETPAGKAPADASSAPALGLEVAGIRITDSRLVYDDQQAGNKITLDPIELSTGAIGSGEPSDISIKFGLSQTNPVMTADINLKTKARLNIETMVFQLADMVLKVLAKGDDLPNGSVDLSVNANIDAALNDETLKIADLVINMGELKLTGNVAVKSFSKPDIAFALNSDLIDLDKLLPETGESQTGGVAQTAPSTNTDDEKIELPTDTLRSLSIDGSLKVGKLIVSGLTTTNLSATVRGKNGVINLDPLTMNLYEGTYTGNAGVNVSGATPKYSAGSDLKNLAIGGLLADLAEDGKSLIRGRSELAFKVTTAGDTVNALKKQLNGNASFKASDGALQSENLAQNVEKAIAFLKGRAPKPAGEELVFDLLSGTAVIQSGVVKNNDLKLVTPLIYANGKGDIDVGKSVIDYVMAVGLSEEPGKAAIPITIKGAFDDPKFGVDLKAAVAEKQKAVVEEKKQELKEKVQEKLGEKLKGFKLF
jgi:AsmA protein